MSRNRAWHLLLILCLSSGALAFADEAIGVITYAFGDVKLNGVEGKENDKIKVTDMLETGENSRAQVMMVDDNVIHLNSNSKAIFKEFEFDEDDNKKWSLIDLIYGSIRSLVNQKYKKEDDQGYQINTPTSVVGVRGTDFLVEHLESEERTEITSFSGELNQGERGTGRKIRNSVRIPSGHFMQLLRGRRAFSRAQKHLSKRYEFLRDTTDHPAQSNNKVFRQVRQEHTQQLRVLRQQRQNQKPASTRRRARK